MEQPALVQLQRAESRQELTQMEVMLRDLHVADERSRTWVLPRLRKQLRALRAELDELPVTGEHGSTMAFRRVRRRCQELQGELLAFAQGLLFREQSLDGRLCGVAERLVDELTVDNPQWRGRVVVPGEAEFLGTGTQVIRIPTIPRSIWRLPLAVHELGHFVGPRIETERQEGRSTRLEYPIAALLEEERKNYGGDTASAHLHETFADAFAVYTMGGAFAASLVLLELRPGDRHTPTHPAAGSRVDAVLELLTAMDNALPWDSPYQHTAAELRRWWDAAVAASGGEPERTGPDSNRHLATIYQWLRRELPDSAHTVSVRTNQIERRLMDNDRALRPEEGDRVLDVLTAAWRVRLRTGPGLDQPDRVGDRALQLCRAIAETPPTDRPASVLGELP